MEFVILFCGLGCVLMLCSCAVVFVLWILMEGFVIC